MAYLENASMPTHANGPGVDTGPRAGVDRRPRVGQLMLARTAPNLGSEQREWVLAEASGDPLSLQELSLALASGSVTQRYLKAESSPSQPHIRNRRPKPLESTITVVKARDGPRVGHAQPIRHRGLRRSVPGHHRGRVVPAI
jgi:hypothetical protein